MYRNNKRRIDDICRGKSKDSYLSPSQAKLLRTWHKHQGRSSPKLTWDTANLTPQQTDALLSALAQCAADAENTTHEFPGNKNQTSRKSSPLEKYSEVPSRPGIETGIGVPVIIKSLETAVSRSLWATAFECIKQHIREEYLCYYAPYAAGQEISYRELIGSLTGLTHSEMIESMRIRKENFRMLLDDLGRCYRDIPDSPEEALEIAISIVKERDVPVLYENLLRDSDIAVQNVIILAAGQGVEIPVDHWVDSDHSGLLLEVCVKHHGWIFQPLESITDIHAYTVYMPFLIDIPELTSVEALGVHQIKDVPPELEKYSFATDVLYFFTKESASAIAVEVQASSPATAHVLAKRVVANLLDDLSIIYPLRKLDYNFQPNVYATHCETGAVNSSWSSGAGIPSGYIEIDIARRNIDLVEGLRASSNTWARQLARCCHLIRIAAESSLPEVRFLNSWRALEAVCGHLTGGEHSADKSLRQCMTQCLRKHFTKLNRSTSISYEPKWFLALVLAVATGRLHKSTKDKLGTFRREHNNLLESLSLSEHIRNRWAMHTGDEREQAYHLVDDETLELSSKWLVREVIYPSFRLLTSIALDHPELENRESVFHYLLGEFNLKDSVH